MITCYKESYFCRFCLSEYFINGYFWNCRTLFAFYFQLLVFIVLTLWSIKILLSLQFTQYCTCIYVCTVLCVYYIEQMLFVLGHIQKCWFCKLFISIHGHINCCKVWKVIMCVKYAVYSSDIAMSNNLPLYSTFK